MKKSLFSTIDSKKRRGMHVTPRVCFSHTPDDLARRSRKLYGTYVNLTISLRSLVIKGIVVRKL